MLTRVKFSFFVIVSALILFVFSSCGDSECVMKVGNTKITSDEYTYYYYTVKDENPNSNSEELKTLTEDKIRSDCALWALADEYEVTLTDDDKEEIESNFSAAESMYEDENEFTDALNEIHLTKDVFKNHLKLEALEISLRDYMNQEAAGIIKSDDKTVENDVRKNFCRIKQIFISNDDGEDVSENKALADRILSELKSGADFDLMVAQYNEDFTQTDDGYAFTYGQMVEPIEETAYELSEGEISEVFEYSGHYAIIKRLPLTDDFINNNFEDLRYYYQCRIFNEMREAAAKELKVKYTDNYNKLELK